MLRFLGDHGLPVPLVHIAAPDLLVMDYLSGGGPMDLEAEAEAGQLIARLHDVQSSRFGLERDTLIGGLTQANPWGASWIDFFRDHRLINMADQAAQAGRLPASIRTRIDVLAANLGEFLEEPARPGLLHGDLWGGNVIVGARGGKGRISGFIDPAISFGHPEIELAFTQMFNTFGPPFFEAYQAVRPINAGFFEQRLELYNLYPTLVHVRLFGGSYLGAVDRTLARYGF